jgi:hypothetical protein
VVSVELVSGERPGPGTRYAVVHRPVPLRSHAEIGAPRVLRPLFRAGIGRDVQGQLRRLKRLLEAGG